MSIIRKVKAVEQLFTQLERETQTFKNKTALNCMPGCGQCCTKPDIEATPLEFLPLAWEWYLNGQSDTKRNQLTEHTDTICISFQQRGVLAYINGNCTTYTHRGLICRLFGFAATRNKEGKPVLSTCKVLKTHLPDAVASANELIIQDEKAVPRYGYYYQRLIDIDFVNGQKFYPINQAIIKAIDMVHQHYTYRPFPRRFKKSA